MSHSSESGETETLPIDAIRPYWRNPRKITEEAVEGVKESMAAFGYVQPIVVDGDNVIIIGHTRYTAMRRAGVTEVEVLRRADLPPAKVKQLRVVDNRTHEYAWWDPEKLWSELDLIGDDPLVRALFPEATAPKDDGGPSTGDLTDLGPTMPDDGPREADFICPSCFHEWSMPVTREQVFGGTIETEALA